LPQLLGELLRGGAHDDVDGAARREGHQYAHRLGRIGLGRHLGRSDQCSAERACAGQTKEEFHGGILDK